MSCKSLLVLFFVLTLWQAEVHGLCMPPCDRPAFCNDGDVTPIPGECVKYYFCEFNQWIEQTCAPGTVFNITNPGQPEEVCQCVLEGDYNSCPHNCPTTIPPTTLPPGPCDNVPARCENGTKYADQSNCSLYHLCVDDELEPMVCELGPVHGYCNVTGLPCAFDINLSQCVNPDREFDCATRCTAEKKKKKPTPEQKTQHAPDENKKEAKKPSSEEKKLQFAKASSNNRTCLSKAQVCNRPPFCTEGERIPEGNGCTQYFQCVYGYWSLVTCAIGAEFDIDLCECVIEGEADCEYNCPLTTPTPTLRPGPCDAPTPCLIQERRVADRTDCEDYHVCIDGGWQQRNCIGGTSDDCDRVGYSCAFDVSTKKCIHPDSSFSCDPRCPTNGHANQLDNKSEVKPRSHPKDIKSHVHNKAGHVIVPPQGHKQGHEKPVPKAINDVSKDSAHKDSVTVGNLLAVTTEEPCLGIDRVCERPPYCSDGNSIGDPTNCTNYYTCTHNRWTMLSCAAGAEFDAVNCACANIGTGTCASTASCPTADPDVTVPVIDCNATEYGTCDGRMDGDSCSEPHDTNLADMVCAEYYYKCFSAILIRLWCSSIGDGCEGHGCVFDIEAQMCKKADANFDPYYRCQTTTVPTTAAATTVDTGQPVETTADGGGSNATTTTSAGTSTTASTPGPEPYAVVIIVIVTAVVLLFLILLILFCLLKKDSKTSPKPDDLCDPDNDDSSDEDSF